MAANPNNPKISTFNVPNNGKVEDSDWTDDIDVDFAIYGGNEKKEGEYINPDKVITKETREKINRIKAKKIGVTTLEIFKDQLQAVQEQDQKQRIKNRRAKLWNQHFIEQTPYITAQYITSYYLYYAWSKNRQKLKRKDTNVTI